jgi:hypothetical protein
MDRKMRGIADPYTLGILIAFVGSLLAYTFNGHAKDLSTDKVERSAGEGSGMQLKWVDISEGLVAKKDSESGGH